MDLSLIVDICIGLAAFRLAWSVDRTQREMLKTQNEMLKIQAQQALILQELTTRIEKVEDKLNA